MNSFSVYGTGTISGLLGGESLVAGLLGGELLVAGLLGGEDVGSVVLALRVFLFAAATVLISVNKEYSPEEGVSFSTADLL